jgi:heat-inducible transcriptional repressor
MERKLSVLRAIVDEFVRSGEPVGSKAIASKHVLGVSSATIRNDMAALEDEGYITAPHTSAGRIPTDKGYRLFVDQLSSVKPMSIAERSAIETFLNQAVDFDDIMVRTTKLLAQLTQQVAVVQYPSLQLTTVRHVELVGLPNRKVMVVVISNTGRVEQRITEVANEIGEVTLDELRHKLNSAIAGVLFVDVPKRLGDLAGTLPSEMRANAVAIVACLLETLIERPEEKIVVSGTSNIAKLGQEQIRTLAPLLEALEENVVLLKLLGEVDSEDLTVRIGHENSLAQLVGAAVVSANYGNQSHAVARLGVVGSTHMNYENNIAAVAAVASYVGRIVTEG